MQQPSTFSGSRLSTAQLLLLRAALAQFLHPWRDPSPHRCRQRQPTLLIAVRWVRNIKLSSPLVNGEEVIK